MRARMSRPVVYLSIVVAGLAGCSEKEAPPSRPPMTADRMPPQKDYEEIPFEELPEMCEYALKIIDDCRMDPDFIQMATVAMDRLRLPERGDEAGRTAQCQTWHGDREIDAKAVGFWGDQYAQIMDVSATAETIDCGTIGAVVASASVPKR
jgi:hypothetical protein